MRLNDQKIASLPKGEHTDSACRGLKVRVTKKLSKSFYLFYLFDGKRKKYRIGSCDIGIETAREAAKKIKARVALGEDPQAERVKEREKKRIEITLRTFLDKHYYPSASKTQRSFGYTKRLLETNYSFLMNTQLSSITWNQIEKWRIRRLGEGIQPQTINRVTSSIKAAMNKSVEMGFLDISPLAGKKKLQAKKGGVVRWLNPDEKDRLLKVLKKRDGYFPVVIYILMYTGARPKEVFTLKWQAVDLESRQITFHAAYTKTNSTRMIPINESLYRVLSKWSGESDWLFPSFGKKGHVVCIDRAWSLVREEAKLVNFRLYDLRHNFASELVQKGVPLYTVSKLLGHSNPQMTTIYAHVSDESLVTAVNHLK